MAAIVMGCESPAATITYSDCGGFTNQAQSIRPKCGPLVKRIEVGIAIGIDTFLLLVSIQKW